MQGIVVKLIFIKGHMMTEWHINQEQNRLPIFAQISKFDCKTVSLICLYELLKICEKSKNDFGHVLYAISSFGQTGLLKKKINLSYEGSV